MKVLQNLLTALAALAVSAGNARADAIARTPLPHDVPAHLDRACRALLAVPADLARESPAWWSRRMSVAACEQRAHLLYPRISDPEQLRGLVAGLDHALRPALAIYQDAIARGPAEIRLLAAYQRGAAYVALMTRARAALEPPADLRTNPEAAARYLALHRELEPYLVGYARDAISAFTLALQIADRDWPAGKPATALVRNLVANTRAQLETLGAN